MEATVSRRDQAVLRSLLEVGVTLSVEEDRQKMLDMILREARKLTSAEAGSLYVLTGVTLRFAAAQNDKLTPSAIERIFQGKELPADRESLTGFVAETGEAVNIPDSYSLPPGAPFRMNREFDSASEYRTRSVLAIPLMRPNGECVGVLQLINHIVPGGVVGEFGDDDRSAIASLASMAAVTVHNALLQDQLKEAQLDCIIRLSVAAEFCDDDTADHIRRISQSSALIAAALGENREFVERIQHASPMHDVGKIGIPDTVLLKPGPLTPAEREIVQTHPQIGADILGDPPNELIAMARDVALTHHERFDGKGYPQGLSGERIPLSGRIVGLADVFDALVSKRCYKDPVPLEEGLAAIRCEEGKHFDPRVTKAFFSRVDVIFPYYADVCRS